MSVPSGIEPRTAIIEPQNRMTSTADTSQSISIAFPKFFLLSGVVLLNAHTKGTTIWTIGIASSRMYTTQHL